MVSAEMHSNGCEVSYFLDLATPETWTAFCETGATIIAKDPTKVAVMQLLDSLARPRIPAARRLKKSLLVVSAEMHSDGCEVSYFLDLATPETWTAFCETGATITGFRKRHGSESGRGTSSSVT